MATCRSIELNIEADMNTVSKGSLEHLEHSNRCGKIPCTQFSQSDRTSAPLNLLNQGWIPKKRRWSSFLCYIQLSQLARQDTDGQYLQLWSDLWYTGCRFTLSSSGTANQSSCWPRFICSWEIIALPDVWACKTEPVTTDHRKSCVCRLCRQDTDLTTEYGNSFLFCA